MSSSYFELRVLIINTKASSFFLSLAMLLSKINDALLRLGICIVRPAEFIVLKIEQKMLSA
jgi:hypothetical protein